MVLRETPPVWRQGFDLYRRRTERDTLGRETAHYAQEPDVRVEAADGLAFQHPRSWNSGGNVGAGEEVRAWGEQPGGSLEACLRTELELAPYDRLDIGGRLWEVRAIQRWPSHRKLMLQRVR